MSPENTILLRNRNVKYASFLLSQQIDPGGKRKEHLIISSVSGIREGLVSLEKSPRTLQSGPLLNIHMAPGMSFLPCINSCKCRTPWETVPAFPNLRNTQVQVGPSFQCLVNAMLPHTAHPSYASHVNICELPPYLITTAWTGLIN